MPSFTETRPFFWNSDQFQWNRAETRPGFSRDRKNGTIYGKNENLELKTLQKFQKIEAKKLESSFKMRKKTKNLKFVYQFDKSGQEFHALKPILEHFLHAVK